MRQYGGHAQNHSQNYGQEVGKGRWSEVKTRKGSRGNSKNSGHWGVEWCQHSTIGTEIQFSYFLNSTLIFLKLSTEHMHQSTIIKLH